jgi:hypothetical protein
MQPDRHYGGPRFPAYYWAGHGSAVIHRLKGFTYGIDTEAYARAYDESRIAWLQREAGVDFLFLSYNWGLPPEEEVKDWEAFEAASSVAHDKGMGVAAYVQPSNAAALGSFASKAWYAVTPKGKRVPYYNGRFFTCLNNVEWREYVHTRVGDAAYRGADAIFLDNCAFGGMPIPLSSDYTAFAGCYCNACQESFHAWQQARGLRPSSIPRMFSPGRNPVARDYAHWRASTLTNFLRDIRDRLKATHPAVQLLTNTVGAVNVNTYFVFGVDLPEIAKIVDWLFVENLQAPRASKGLLVQNAGTFKLLQSLKPDAPALSISYDRGIGVDGIPAPKNFARTTAEAIATGGVPVLRATEFIEAKKWTLLQPRLHDEQCHAARRIVDFARSRDDIFADRKPAATVGVLVPPRLAWTGDIFPGHGADYLGVIQSLVCSAIPFRMVSSLANPSGLRVLLVPDGTRVGHDFRGRVLTYSELGLRKRRRSLFDFLGKSVEPLASVIGPKLIDGYYRRVHVRRFADRVDILFRLLFRDQFVPLEIAPSALAVLHAVQPITVVASSPVLAELWQSEGRLQLHLLNYREKPVRVSVQGSFGEIIAVSTPAGSRYPERGVFTVDDYAVVEWSAANNAIVPTDSNGRTIHATPA